jgi:hypothetical protein
MFLHKKYKLSEKDANSPHNPDFPSFFNRKGKKACPFAYPSPSLPS